MYKLSITLLCLILSNIALAGCKTPDGSIMPVGHIYAIDEHHPQRITDEKAFIEEHGVEPDGGRYKFAVCSFEIILEDQDYPAKLDRRYFWVAGGDLPRKFTEKDVASYKD